jgi:uncharacterized protein (TIGR02145 family)
MKKLLFYTVFLCFIAFSCDKNDEETSSPAKDGDGNEYKTVTIGDQVWMAENLRTTKYNDGTPIPNLTEYSEWINTKSGAYCWLYGSISFKDTYGALYNWEAVNSGKLCPKGWRIPTKEDWIKLEEYLAKNGYNIESTTDTISPKVAKSLASSTGWEHSYRKGAIGNTDYPEFINKSGFNALPSGGRSNEFGYCCMTEYAYWWSSTEYGVVNAYAASIGFDYYAITISNTYYKNMGLSVRCIKE